MSGPASDAPASGRRAASQRAVLVTGASGFIGSRLARRLSAEGYSVRCLVREGSDVSALGGLAVETVRGTLDDAASLRQAASGCGEIVHCAAMVSDWGTVEEIRAANVRGTRHVLDAAAAAGVRRLVHISTTDVYGHPAGGPRGEDPSLGRFANWYAQTKLEAEIELRSAARSSALETVILRPATVYGPGSKALVAEIARAIRARQMVLVDGGRADAGLLYVENLLDAVLIALHHPLAIGETFDLSDELGVSWARFTGEIAAGLGARPVSFSLPYRLAFAIALVLESGYRLARRATGLRLAPLLSRQAVQVLGRDQSFSAAKARALLGWEPRIGYEEGLRSTLAWLREQPQRRRGTRTRVDAAPAGL
jgi:nucleoside-diphosphate-sugar epimerase